MSDSPRALVVADDLTGTLDSAHGFATRGRGVSVRLLAGGVLGPAQNPPVDDVVAVDADSRNCDKHEAARRVRGVVAGVDAGVTYKKVDSTLRGNVVAEVDAALGASEADIAVVAPAFPSTGRTTHEGTHYVDGVPLADAGYGVDRSALTAVFGGSHYSVEELPLSTVEAGADAVADSLAAVVSAAERPVLLVCDATTADHLAAVATGTADAPVNPLYVGSGGLAQHIAVPGDPTPRFPPPRTGDGVIGVVGSVNPRTFDALDALEERSVVRLDPAAAVRDPDAVAEAVAPTLADRVHGNGRAVVTAAVEADDVDRAAAAAKRLGSGREGSNEGGVDPGDRIARALAGTARAAVTDGPTGDVPNPVDPTGLFLTGGDVARETIDALDCTALGVTGSEGAAGVPEGWIEDGAVAGTRVMTKAGGFGDRGVIVNCLDLLETPNE
ncbi:four-carbon acid sugar kinase family protein [Halorubrum gandharaense]